MVSANRERLIGSNQINMIHKTIHISPELHQKLKLEALKMKPPVSLRELVEKKLEVPLTVTKK